MFERFRNKTIRFMSGRYARLDTLGSAIMLLYALLCIVNAFFCSTILSVIIFALLALSLARILSKNISKRSSENQRFLRFWTAVKREVKLVFDRMRNIKTNRFRKCPHCKAIIKLPNKRGSHIVRCPKCGEKFDVKIL